MSNTLNCDWRKLPFEKSCEKRRRYKRTPVNWEATCRIGQMILSGKIIDLSAEGVFFKPECGMLDTGELTSDFIVTDIIGPGEIVTIKVDMDGGYEIPCVVKWVGESLDSGMQGFGTQFAYASMPYVKDTAARDLMGALWKQSDNLSMLVLKMAAKGSHHVISKDEKAHKRMQDSIEMIGDALTNALFAEDSLLC